MTPLPPSGRVEDRLAFITTNQRMSHADVTPPHSFPEPHAAVGALAEEIPHAGTEFIQTSSGAKPAFGAPLTAAFSRTENGSFSIDWRISGEDGHQALLWFTKCN